jgi:hypothetical protein
VDFQRAWQLAELRWWSSALAAFVVAYTADEERAREAAQIADSACSSDVEGLEVVRERVQKLAVWAGELADHPHYPAESRPDEADRQVRDHLKDIVRDHLPAEFRDWMSGTQLSLDVTFQALRDASALDPRARQDAFYLYGRATMALEVGDRETAERELERLRDLRAVTVRQSH